MITLRNNFGKGEWGVAAGAGFISFAAVLVKLAAASGMAPTSIGLWRVGVASVVCWGLFFFGAKQLALPRKARRMALFAGLCFAADLFFWHKSILAVGVGMATMLASTQVFWSALVAKFVLGDNLSPRLLLGALIGLLGVTFLVGIGSQISFTPEYVFGLGFGFATGVSYAGYILSIRQASIEFELFAAREPVQAGSKLTRTTGILAYSTLASTVGLLVLATLESSQLAPPSTQAFVFCLLLAIGPHVLGWMFISLALPKVQASVGALILLSQPLLATVWGVLFFREELTALQCCGAVLVLVGLYLGNSRSGPAGK